MAKDPVCDMNVEETQAAGKATYRGKTYYFCSTACKVMFEKAPAMYVKE